MEVTTPAAPAKPHIPPLQVVWLVIYWLAVLTTIYFWLYGATNGVAAYSMVILSLALAASVIGAVFGTTLLRNRVASHWFVKGTTTARVIAIAWIFLGLAINIGPVVSVLFNVDLTNDALTGGVLGTVGSVSFLAILGPGYSEYRDALSTLTSHAA